jgi:hypothetical protein
MSNFLNHILLMCEKYKLTEEDKNTHQLISSINFIKFLIALSVRKIFQTFHMGERTE